MQMRMLLVVTIMFLWISVVGQTTYFDLSFENKDSKLSKWFLVNDNAVTGVETLDHIDGSGSLCFLSDPACNPFSTSAFQTIQLPVTTQNIELSIYAKSVFIDDFWLRLLCLDGDENLIRRDSINIASPDSWRKFTLATKAAGTQRIYIEIGASTKAPSVSGKKVFSKAYVDHITLKLDGQNIESIVSPIRGYDTEEITKIKKNYPLSPNRIESLSWHEDFQEHTILGFGETVHGSHEIQKFTFEAIKQLIKNSNCKLVIFEVPFELGLRLNAYVEGKEQKNVENLMFLANMDIPALTDFLNWLRQYNQQATKKVVIAGVDDNEVWQPEDNLVQFIKSALLMNTNVGIEIVQCLDSGNYKKAIEVTESNTSLFRDQNIQKCIIHAIKARAAQQKPAKGFDKENRECTQFRNIQFDISTFTSKPEKTAIMAHLDHLNKINNLGNRYCARNLGSYLAQEYAEKYFVTAMLVGAGTITSFDKNGYSSKFSLLDAPGGSLEGLCLEVNESAFYKNMKTIRALNFGRIIGATYSYNQFLPYSHVGRFDGLVFIRNSTGNHLPESWPKTIEEIREYVKKHPGVKKK